MGLLADHRRSVLFAELLENRDDFGELADQHLAQAVWSRARSRMC
jgi:hypothetical protein